MAAKLDELTRYEETFLHYIYHGTPPSEAYLKAHPHLWPDAPSERRKARAAHKACILMQRKPAKNRYREIVEENKKEVNELQKWNRNKSVEAAMFLVQIGREEIERIQEAHEEEYNKYSQRKQLAIDDGRIEDEYEYEEKMLKVKKATRLSTNAIRSIETGLNILNRMHGFEEKQVGGDVNITFVGETSIQD